MRILIAAAVSREGAGPGLEPGVAYRPELASRSADELCAALAEHRPDVLIAPHHIIDHAALTAWRARCPQHALLLCVTGQPGPEALAALAGAQDIPISALPAGLGDTTAVLAAAEKSYVRDVLARSSRALVAARRGASTPAAETVTLVGAGIANLMTAQALVEAGYHVTVLDRAADPRTRPPPHTLGATHGGGNARMCTVTEADIVHAGAHAGDVSAVMRARVSQGGWLLWHKDQHTARERAFIDAFHRVPTWLGKLFRDDTYALNQRGIALWNAFIDAHPALFDHARLAPTIVRLYTDPEALDHAVGVHRDAGALRAVLTPGDVIERHPALAAAARAGELAGALEVDGFTVNIHDLSTALLDHLERRGARLQWQCPVRGIEVRDGVVTGLRADAPVAASDHYVLSPGVARDGLLAGTRCDNQIHGLLGIWLTVPNLDPTLGHSVKIQRGRRFEQINVTLCRDAGGRESLLLSSGYAYTGERALDLDHPELEPLFASLEDCARRFFPENHRRASADGSLRASRAACIRPWTPWGLGLFDIMETAARGRLLITGGHNTGGFAQSLATAEAVVAALQGEPHPMHVDYHPARGSGVA